MTLVFIDFKSRIRIEMPRTSRALEIEHNHGNFYFGGPGYDVTTLRGKRGPAKPYDAVVLLKGGLGNPSSSSMLSVARKVVEVSDGKVVAAVVGTSRPWSPFAAASELMNARKHQSQSVFKAGDYLNDRFHSPVLVEAGQSRGAVSVVDGGLHEIQHKKRNKYSPTLGVVTIDGPGVFGPLERDEHIVLSLAKLAIHCMEDIAKLDKKEQLRLFGKVMLETSIYEPAYFWSDVNYLKDVDLSGKISQLRRCGAEVRHIFHDQDIVPGAEVESPFSVVLPGGHLRFMVEPEPVASNIVEFAWELQEKRETQTLLAA